MLQKRIGDVGIPCSDRTYTTDTFVPFWNGEWDDAWVGHCDVYAWRGASSCLYNSTSTTTPSSVGPYNVLLTDTWSR